MKILIYTDVHWSSYSSIVRSRGTKYSKRLENLIQSVNWAEETAVQQHCDCVFCLGDFFDAAQLNSEEVTSLNDIVWSDLPHYFLVGNHEMGRNDLQISTSHLFEMHDNFIVIDKPLVIALNDFHELVCIPYLLDSTNYDFTQLFTVGKDQVVLSHNDIKGIQMGKFESTMGIDLDLIHNTKKLFINGHLHNGEQFGNLINLGNLTGQNFSEDGFKYSHNAMLLDTDKREFYLITNPYALNFYKIDETDKFIPYEFSTFNNVVSCTTSLENLDRCKEMLSGCVESRISISYEATARREQKTFEKVDKLKEFQDYVLKNIGDNEIIREELSHICR